MKQRARLLIEFPENTNVAQLEKELVKKGYKVEILAVLNPLMGFRMPKEFSFEDDKVKP
jgi:hypothetical protein